MACPKLCSVVNNALRVHWTGHDAHVSVHRNDVATPPIVTLWVNIISLTFFIQLWWRNFSSNFPMNDLNRDSIGNKLFGFVFSRSDEPIVIGVCGLQSADQDHRIGSELIMSGSFPESGPGHPKEWSPVNFRQYWPKTRGVWDYCRRIHWRNDLKFGMQLWHDHL